MLKIKAVLFDLFGTLIPCFQKSEFIQLIAEMAEILEVDANALEEQWRETNVPRAIGKLKDSEEALRAIMSQLGGSLTKDKIRAVQERRRAFIQPHMKPFEGAEQVLRDVAKSGRKYALVSDCSAEIPENWPSCPLSHLFEVTAFSCQVGHKKPEPEIYLYACQRLGVEPEECVFVGDGGSNELRGAENLGITPILADYQENAFRYDEDRNCELRAEKILDIPRIIEEIESHRAQDSST